MQTKNETWSWRLYGKRQRKAAITLVAHTLGSTTVNQSSARSQQKLAGTQKVFPLSPLTTPLFPSQKNKECNYTSGGQGETLFTQHCSCPASFRCSINF